MSGIYYFDIGNTRAKFWRCHDGVIVEQASVVHGGNAADIPRLLPSGFSEPPGSLLGAAVLDEEAVSAFAASCVVRWQVSPQFAQSSAAHAGVISAYDAAPATLGVDRWIGLIAVVGMGGGVCVVDCGTATTIDVLRADGHHLGGYILPGLDMMTDVLLQSTRRVRFDRRSTEGSTLPGRSTAEAVMHGALAALAALVEKTGEGRHVVLTGGDASRLSAVLACPHVVEPDLLLKGLQRYFSATGIN